MGTECLLAAYLAEQCTATNPPCCLPDVCTLGNCSIKGELRCGFGAEQVEKGEASLQPCPAKGSRTAVSRAPGSTSTAGQAAGVTQAPGIFMAVSLEGASALLQNRTAPLPVPAGAQGVLQLQDAVRTTHPNSFLGSLNSSACPAVEPQD